MYLSITGAALLGATLLIFFSVIVAQPELCQACNQYCQQDEFIVGIKRMVLFAQEKNWWDAKAHCEKIGMRLLTTSTKYQVDLLKDYLNSRIWDGPPDIQFWGIWLDASSLDADRVWKWRSTGELVTYTTWGQGEPTGEYQERCLELKWIRYNETQWNDNYCNVRMRFICEKEVA